MADFDQSSTTRWKYKVDSLLSNGAESIRGYIRADIDMTRRAVRGLGPDDSTTTDKQAGVRAVVNISNVHVPSFCRESKRGTASPYKNGYDLGQYRIGATPVRKRERLDHALAAHTGARPEELYYAAVELNGVGVRYFGDVCLVIRNAPEGTVVLDRNSYDLFRAPWCDTFNIADDSELLTQVRTISGSWGSDLGDIVALKVLQGRPERERRMTTGQIAHGVLDDEDYIEVIKVGSFSAHELEEARLSPADVAIEDHLRGLSSRGPVPPFHQLVWMARRRKAESALRSVGVSVRTVTDHSRTKG